MLSRDAAQALQPVWVLDFGIDTLWKALVQADVEGVNVGDPLTPTVLEICDSQNLAFSGIIRCIVLNPILSQTHGNHRSIQPGLFL